jgi:hypothetical protein
MGHIKRMLRRDVGGLWSEGRERMGTVAAKNPREPPEGVRNHAHPQTRCSFRIEGMIVIVGHAWHDQRTLGPNGGLQRRN